MANDAVVLDLNAALAERKSLSMTDVVDSIVKVVPLETSEASVVGNVINVAFSSERIFVFDNIPYTSVAIFDSEGHFVRRLPHGKGPGEIYNAQAISYDKWRGRLSVLQSPFLLHYTPDGEHISTERLPLHADGLCVLEDGYAFGHTPALVHDVLDGYNVHSQTITDLKFGVKGHIGRHASPHSVYTPYGVTVQNDHVNLTVPYSDTMATMEGDVLRCRFVLDYSSKKLDPSRYSSPVEVCMAKITDGLMCFAGRHAETSRHIAFSMPCGTRPFVCYYDKVSKVTKAGFPFSDPSLMIHIDEPITAQGDTFISVVAASSYVKGLLVSERYISAKRREVLDSLEPDANPIVLYFTMKEFAGE